jgi:hypothetical protein
MIWKSCRARELGRYGGCPDQRPKRRVSGSSEYPSKHVLTPVMQETVLEKNSDGVLT